MPEEPMVVAREAGDLLTNVDWSTAGPKIAIAFAVVLVVMWLGVVIIRKVANVLLPLTALSFCMVAGYLILSNQVTTTIEIVIASGVIGAMGAIVCIPALSLKKDK